MNLQLLLWNFGGTSFGRFNLEKSRDLIGDRLNLLWHPTRDVKQMCCQNENTVHVKTR